MGIYLPNMEMPENCWDCKLFYDFILCLALQDQPKRYTDTGMGRPPECPLIEVPEPHGRLIDADDLLLDMTVASEDDDWQEYFVYADDIVNAPTTIPASEEG